MTDPEDRNQESRETEETRYDRLADEEAARRSEVARRLAGEPLPERDDEEG